MELTEARQNDATSLQAFTSPVSRVAEPSKGHLEWIDALRGLAALWVIIYHSRSFLWVGAREIQHNPAHFSAFDGLAAWLSIPVAFGGSAVMLFFVLSGFCVHLPYAAGDKIALRQYTMRRGLRILPPYWCAVALTVGIEWLAHFLGGPNPTGWTRILRVVTLSQNYGPLAGQIPSNGALWSLPVETELYVAYLGFFYLLRRCGLKSAAIVLALSGGATLGYFCGIKSLADNYLRFWLIWCGGAFLAEALRNPSKSLPTFKKLNGITFCLAAVAAACGELRHWFVGLTQCLWGLVYFHVVWLALLNPGSIKRLGPGAVKLLVWMGSVSYSAYLIHYPLFALWGFVWQRSFGAKPANFFIAVLCSLAVWPIAWAFWRVCEFPFHRLAQRLTRSPVAAP